MTLQELWGSGGPRWRKGRRVVWKGEPGHAGRGFVPALSEEHGLTRRQLHTLRLWREAVRLRVRMRALGGQAHAHAIHGHGRGRLGSGCALDGRRL